MMNVRRFWWIAAVAGVMALAAACAPPTAPAPAPLIECAGVQGGITYTPPATNSGEDITIATQPGAELSGCVDNTGSGITRGDLDLSILLPGYLCGPLDTGEPIGSGAGTVTWSDGSTSTLSVDGFGGSGGSFISEITFTAGRFAGASGSVATFVTSADGSCTPSSGVTQAFLSSDDPIAFVAPVAPLLPPRTDLAAVDSGTGSTACSVMSDGTVTCWGDNSKGQLGNALLAPGSQALLPIPVTGITDAVGVSIGVDHACATLGSGAVRCWGNNRNGQLGNGTTNDSTVPLPVAGLGDVQQVSVGYRRTCALLADSTVQLLGRGCGRRRRRQLDPDRGPRADRGHPTHRRLVAPLRTAHRPDGPVLGRQPVRPARQRHHDRLPRPGPGRRGAAARQPGQRRVRAHLRARHHGRGVVLGVQPPGTARAGQPE